MNVDRKDFLELSQEILENGALLRFRARGESMHPFIAHGDILIVEPANGTKANIGDVVFYRRVDGALTAHRLVKVNQHKDNVVFITKGDSLDYFDPPVLPEQVLGRVITLERDGRSISLDSRINKIVAKFVARLSPRSRRLRPVVRPAWRLFRNLSPNAVPGSCIRTVQGIPVYRRVAGLLRAGVEVKEASEEEVREVSAWSHPDQIKPPAAPDINCTCFMASKRSRIVGSVELVRRPKKYYPFDGYWLSSLRVRTAYRGMGIGEELSRKVIAKSQEEDAEGLHLMVLEDNHRALKLYQKLGFQLKVIPAIEEYFERERNSPGPRYIIMLKSLVEHR